MKVVLKKVQFISVTFLILLLTWLRENFFLSLNAFFAGENYNKAYFYYFNDLFNYLPVEYLYVIKWGVTILFILAISILTVLAIKIWFNKKMFNDLLIKIYGVIFLISILLFLLLIGSDLYGRYYFVLRKIIGLIQSPIPLLLAFTLFYFLAQEDENNYIKKS